MNTPAKTLLVLSWLSFGCANAQEPQQDAVTISKTTEYTYSEPGLGRHGTLYAVQAKSGYDYSKNRQLRSIFTIACQHGAKTERCTIEWLTFTMSIETPLPLNGMIPNLELTGVVYIRLINNTSARYSVVAKVTEEYGEHVLCIRDTASNQTLLCSALSPEHPFERPLWQHVRIPDAKGFLPFINYALDLKP